MTLVPPCLGPAAAGSLRLLGRMAGAALAVAACWPLPVHAQMKDSYPSYPKPSPEFPRPSLPRPSLPRPEMPSPERPRPRPDLPGPYFPKPDWSDTPSLPPVIIRVIPRIRLRPVEPIPVYPDPVVREVARPKAAPPKAAPPKTLVQRQRPRPVVEAKPVVREVARPKPPPPKAVVQRQRPPRPPAAPVDQRRFVPDEILLEARSGTVPAALVRQHRLALISSQRIELLGTTLYRYRITDRRSVPALVGALQGDARIAAAQPNAMFRLGAEAGNGALSAAQYAIAKVRAREAHDLAVGQSVPVAVIDSGIDGKHPELAGSVADTFDPVGGTGKPHAHGTGIAGIIAAHAQLTGVAPGARLLAIRAFVGEAGKPGADGTTFHIVQSIDWAHQRGARVVNMSFAGPRDALLTRVLAAGEAKGMIFIAAAGNEGPKAQPAYPAAEPGVIAVTASDPADRLYQAANRGPYICVTAPGVDVLVPAPAGAYGFSSGTSIAAAHVSGAIALLLQLRPDITARDVRALLARSAKDLGGKGDERDFGAGLVDALAMVSEAKGAAGPGGLIDPAASDGPATGAVPARAGKRVEPRGKCGAGIPVS